MIRKSLFAIALAASLGTISGASAQGPASGGETGASATVPSAASSSGTATGATGTLRPETSTTAVTPSGTRVDTTVAPGGAVGSKAPDANAAAPAGR